MSFKYNQTNDSKLEMEIRFRITSIQVYLSYISIINHFKVKYRLGLLHERVDNCLELLESKEPKFTEINRELDLVEIFLRQI